MFDGQRLARSALIGAALLAFLLPAPSAAAHSFLASTRPAQGDRLPSPPSEIALQFSEPVVSERVDVRVVDGDGQAVELGLPELAEGGLVVRVPFVEPKPGVYRVSWGVQSAVDSHRSAGEFAFAGGLEDGWVGDEEPAVGDQEPWAKAAGAWLLFAGWGIAAGTALVSSRLDPADRSAVPRGAPFWITVGALVGLAGLGLRLLAISAVGRADALVAMGAAVSLAAALALRRTPGPALAALAATALVWPLRSHATGYEGWVGWGLDVAHFSAAGVWVGGLALSVVALVGVRRDRALLVVRRYAPIGAVTVLILAITGVMAALLLVPSPEALVSTGYGRLLLAKTALLLAALAAAAVARWRLLPHERARTLRRVTAPELATVLAALAVAAVLIDVPPPRPAAGVLLLGPPPIEGPVVRTAGVAGLISVFAHAGDGRLDVQTLGPSGGIDSDLTLEATFPDGTRVELHPRSCGTGCRTQRFTLPPGETLLSVRASADGWPGGQTRLSLAWPPAPEEPALFERMRQAMRSVEQMEIVEYSAGQNPQGRPHSELEGEQFVELMPWAGGGVSDVRPHREGGNRFTFFLPGSSMWFDVTVDENSRLLHQRLVNPGHDIRYRFTYPH